MSNDHSNDNCNTCKTSVVCALRNIFAKTWLKWMFPKKCIIKPSPSVTCCPTSSPASVACCSLPSTSSTVACCSLPSSSASSCLPSSSSYSSSSPVTICEPAPSPTPSKPSSSPAARRDTVSFTESTSNALLAVIAAKNADTDKFIFSNYTAVDSLTRNTNNPLHNLEGVTGIIAWNDRKYGKPKGTQLVVYAVTPRHIVSARHAAYLTGDKVWFVARDNTLIERTVIAHRSPLYRSVSYLQGDYVIGLLDSDLPTSIEPLEVLPPDFYKYLDNTEFNDTTWKAKDVFFVHTNQKEQSLFSKLNNIIFKVFEDPDPLTYNPANAGYFQRARQSKNAISEWSGPVIGGDSGSPSMFIVGTKLVPFSVWSTAMVGNFFGQARNYNDLNRLIVDTDAKAGISTGYTLTDIDMSGFKVYSQSVPNSTPSSYSASSPSASRKPVHSSSASICSTASICSPSTSCSTVTSSPSPSSSSAKK